MIQCTSFILTDNIMPDDTYPVNYLNAREKFSRQFLSMYDKLIYEQTPGVDTAFLSVLMLPLGLGLIWALESNRKCLYNDLVAISEDRNRLLLIDQNICITALESHVLELNDLTLMPIHVLNFILKPDIICIIQQDADLIKQKKRVLEEQLIPLREQANLEEAGQIDLALQRRIKQLRVEHAAQKTIIENLRKANYSANALNRFLPQINMQRQAQSFFEAPPINTHINNGHRAMPMPEQNLYLEALKRLQNRVPLIKDEKTLTKTVQIINHVKRLKKQGNYSDTELANVLNNTTLLFQGDISPQAYKNFAKKTQGKPSTGMKILGGLMIALGATIAIVGVGVAASGNLAIGLGTSTAGIGIAALGLTFFAQKGLAKTMNELSKSNLQLTNQV